MGQTSMLEMLQWSVMQRALMGGTLVAFLASYYGVFVVQRRLAFLGSGLAHAAFGGVALGLLLDVQPLAVAVPFTALVAVAIVWVEEHTHLAGDTSIGIFFAMSMALGIIFLWMREGYTGDAFALLFGSILAIRNEDIYITAAIAALTLLMSKWWGNWAYTTFDPHLAAADRLNVRAHNYLLAISIAVVVVISIKVVGLLLVAAFLVLPAATARLISPTYAIMTMLSVLTGCLTVIAGLVLSYFADLPSSAVIILLQSAVFFLLMGVHALVMARKSG